MVPPDGSCTVPVIAPVAPPCAKASPAEHAKKLASIRSLVNMDTYPLLYVSDSHSRASASPESLALLFPSRQPQVALALRGRSGLVLHSRCAGFAMSST